MKALFIFLLSVFALTASSSEVITFDMKFSEPVNEKAITYELTTIFSEVGSSYNLKLSLTNINFAEDSKSAKVSITGISGSYFALLASSIGQYM